MLPAACSTTTICRSIVSEILGKLLLKRDLAFGRSEMQDTVADLRAQLQSQAGQLERAAAVEGDLLAHQHEADSLQSQLLDQQQANDQLQREATLAHIQLEESREAFRVRIQHCMLQVCSQPPPVSPFCS